MSDVEEDENEFGTVELSEVDKAFELVSHFSILTDPDCRELLVNHRNDTFRVKHLDRDDGRSLVMILSANFMIEKADLMGRPTDWQLTDRCKRMLRYQDRHGLFLYDKQAEAILSVGEDVWRLPDRGTHWRVRDLDDTDLEGRKLGLLREHRLIEAVDEPAGEPNTWQITEKLSNVRQAIWGFINA